MYFPYLRGRQFELIALRELLENNRISKKIIPIVEPINPTSTLLKTLKCFAENERKIAIVYNPTVGDFFDKLKEKEDDDSKVAKELRQLLDKDKNIIKSYIMESDIAQVLKEDIHKREYLIVNKTRDDLDAFLEIYEKNEEPNITLMPDDRAFKRIVKDTGVLFEDRFKKKTRNVDYIDSDDEFFSDDHLCFEEEGYKGFADYSIVGQEFSESGFAPVAVAIHLVYLTEEEARIHHFVSDSNIGIEDPAGKFGEALEKLVNWCNDNNIQKTLGLEGFYNCYHEEKYPGLGTVKKYSIMHHLELISNFLGGNK